LVASFKRKDVTMKLKDLIRRVDELIEIGEKTLETKYSGEIYDYVNEKQFQFFRSATLSFLLKLFGIEHPYYSEFITKVEKNHVDNVTSGLGILNAVRNELSGGWTESLKSIISAEIFSDFLEMASYLLAEGYKDASAVMIGSTLEEHLRQLCITAKLPLEITKSSGEKVTKKADVLNADLAKQGIYNVLDQKNLTAWFDLRNKAAHGKYSEYTKEQVYLMYQGVMEFIARNTP
jgi:hypothetical protein